MKQIYRLYGLPCCIYRTPLSVTLFLSLLFLLLTGITHAQVNAYARVTAINAARTQLTIDNRNETYHTFVPNEQVLVIQMQDDVIGTNVGNNTSFGNLNTGILKTYIENLCGLFE